MGLITLVAGLIILAAPVTWAFPVMVLSTAFGAAAAIGLPALGGASVLVPSLFLVFFTLRVFMACGEGQMLAALAPGRPGFWLLALTAFGLLSAVWFPRLFEGMTETMTVERVAGARNVIALTPLRFTSNNITQSVYALGGLVCFAATFAYFRHAGRPEHLVKAILAVAMLDLGFALADVLTYFTGTEYLMSFVRTANYAMLTAAEKGGLKRISGSFPEASAFSEYTLVLFGVTASLWLDRVRPGKTGIIAALLLAALLLSTSATALIGVSIVLTLLWIRTAVTSMHTPRTGRPAFLVVSLAVIPAIALTLATLFPAATDSLQDFMHEMLLSKADSQSGRERAMWNAMAYQAFLDTFGWGAGLGSARASSYLLVLMSNLGVLGVVLFAIFTGTVLLSPSPSTHQGVEDVTTATIRAAKIGLVSVLAAALVSGTVYDLGMMFFVLAGSAVALGAFRLPAATTLYSTTPGRHHHPAPESVR